MNRAFLSACERCGHRHDVFDDCPKTTAERRRASRMQPKCRGCGQCLALARTVEGFTTCVKCDERDEARHATALPTALRESADLLEEAAAIVSRLPPEVFEALGVRHYLCDEMEGAAKLLRNCEP